MKGWIFNASPLILLGKIRQLHLIETLSPPIIALAKALYATDKRGECLGQIKTDTESIEVC